MILEKLFLELILWNLERQIGYGSFGCRSLFAGEQEGEK
jgi:hypothetical protein